MDAGLDELSVDDIGQTEDRIISQWREVSANEKHQLRVQVDKLVRPLGLKTRLLVLEHANSIALYFLCMTLSAIIGLHDQWSNGELRDIVQSLFTFLSSANSEVCVKRLTWSQSDYERCLEFFHSLSSKQIISCQGY